MNKIHAYLLHKINPVKFAKKTGVKLGSNVEISNTVNFSSEPYLIEIGNNTKITRNVAFIPHDGGVHVLRNLNSKYEDVDLIKGKIIVGDNVFIGNNVIILGGVKIGNNVIIGCGSVVTKDIPHNSVVAGIPAKIICTIENYENKNRKYFHHTKKLNKNKKKQAILAEINK